MRNALATPFQKGDSSDKHANKIKDFLKKAIAAQSYHKMFYEGAYFKDLGIDLAAASTPQASLHSLQHLNDVSGHYLKEIRGKTQNLTIREKELLAKIVDAKLHLRHQSNANVVSKSGTLNLFSFNKLQGDKICAGKNTFELDITSLSNHDFVFFAVEFCDDENQLPLNTRHSTADFGANAYIIEDRYPYGYMTLTDHFDNTIQPAFSHEHQDFVRQFTKVRSETHRKVHGDRGPQDAPIFNTKDMKLGLGLHLIDFLRKTHDHEFRDFALQKNLDSKSLDRILNFLFQPEFHVPRMVSTSEFKVVKLREITVEEAVKASNLEALSAHLTHKDIAGKAMGFAIRHAKKDVADYLFAKFNFTREDAMKMPTYREDIEYMLSNYYADEKILKAFLDRGLAEPNRPFRKVNAGETMLDNAIKYRKHEMVDLLLQHGALSGKEINNQIKSRGA